MELFFKVVGSYGSDILAECLDVNHSFPMTGAAASHSTVVPMRYSAQIL